jgi:hypothetical protein
MMKMLTKLLTKLLKNLRTKMPLKLRCTAQSGQGMTKQVVCGGKFA